MIDIVFQLLIFFMLNLKIVAPEGNFNINMPIAAPQAAASEQNLPRYQSQLDFGSPGKSDPVDARFKKPRK